MDKLTLKGEEGQTVIKMLGFASLICFTMLAGRIYYSSSLYFVFLIWNLLLAWIPLFFSNKLVNVGDPSASRLITGSLFFAWLLFFPNSPYILTDLFHLKQKDGVPLWYDLVLIISFAWNGLMIGFVSLLEIQRFLNRNYSRKISWVVVIMALILSGFGIYLGRYERWNSWDILTNPLALMMDVMNRLLNPFSYPKTFGVTLLFSSFLIVSYLTLFTLIKSKSHEQ